MTVNNIARNQMSEAMLRVASGNRINNAADDAAGLAIMESMTAQIRGLDQGTRNTEDMQALVNTAEGGLDGITDSLQRIRELSVQAANGTLSQANRDQIQTEIDQLASNIQSQVRDGVQFNTMNLLDGTVTNANTASSANGTGAGVTINDMSDMAQAVANYNVTGDISGGNPPGFDINEIDSVINEVVRERANLGAVSNSFDYTASANSISSLNLADARSRVGDADMAREMMRVNQERVINDMQVMLQRQQQDQEEERARQVAPPGMANLQ